MLPLYDYQQTGAEWLAQRDQAFLGDDMGVGKSAQAVAAADAVQAEDILVLCPASLRTNWCREFSRFSGRQRQVTPVFTLQTPIPTTGSVVISYDLASNPKVQAKLMAREWDLLILDEAHYLKNRTAKRTKTTYGARKTQPGLSTRAKRVWRLSGTPAPNNAAELWTHFKSMGLLQDQEDYYAFEARYCKGYQAPFGYVITGHRNVQELKDRMVGVFLRRKKSEVLQDLPPIYWHQVTVDKQELGIPPDLIKEAMAQDNLLGRQIDTGNFDSLMQQAQSYATLRRYTAWAKVDSVADILANELAADPSLKVVIFGVHTDPLLLLAHRLHEFRPVMVIGSTPADHRQMAVDRFQSDPDFRVFIGNVVAAGTGVTLTASSEVAFLEQDWVPGNNLQAAMRTHRIGQGHPVRVRVFSLAGSCDEQVQDVLTRKTTELAKIEM